MHLIQTVGVALAFVVRQTSGAAILTDTLASSSGWTLSGAVHLPSDARCDGGTGGCLQVSQGGSATKAVDTSGSANIYIILKVSAVGLAENESCHATVTSGPSFSSTVLVVADGADDGAFSQAALTVPGTPISITVTFGNSAAQPVGLCFGDTIAVSGDPVQAAGSLVLPATALGEITRLQRACGGPTEVGVARSYDGRDWSPVAPSSLPVTCVSGVCSVNIPNDGVVYCLHDVDTQYVPTGADAVAARLLSQATFGATATSISYVATNLSGNVTAFLAEQFAEPATLLRQYGRERSSPLALSDDGYGALRSACEAGARWTAYSFHFADIGKVFEAILDGESAGFYAIYMDGVVLTEVVAASWTEGGGNFTICQIYDFRGFAGNSVRISPDGCASRTWIPNPPVHFEAPNPSVLDFTGVPLTQHATRSDDVVFVTGPTAACVGNILTSVAFMCTGVNCASFYRYDPRVRTLENSLTSPALNGDDAGECPAVVRTFLNKDSCIKSPACSQPITGSAPMTLDDATLRAWFTESNVYAYRVMGLELQDPFRVSPCESGPSRWLRIAGTCPSATLGIDSVTNETIHSALDSSTDPNPYVRDISLTGADCTDTADETIGMQIQVGNECFEHVHPHLFDVRDFSLWTIIHDGNPSAAAGGRPNPIAKWAHNNETVITFPSNHPMSRWQMRNHFMPLAGRFGDVIDFSSLPSEMQSVEIAELVGAVAATGAEAFATCGSPGEVANEPHLGHFFYVQGTQSISFERLQLDYPTQSNAAKSVLWTDVVFRSADQLRQRVAWVLSQILVTSDSIGRSDEVEPWAAYYDIFVRHAFGSYRDILREVSYNPLMGDYLSFRGNRAYASSRNFPDENFAREIMQLFSIGLFKVASNGQHVLDGFGNPIDTYSNDDIVAFARIWTGLDRQVLRGNLEQENAGRSRNVVDPMQITAKHRDRLPKTKLDAGYIGDGYPLCHELPSQEFLREGAVYELTGSSSIEGSDFDDYSSLPDEVFQAEAATLSTDPGAPSVSTSGSYGGYVSFESTSTGAYIEWTISRTSAQTVDLFIYYKMSGSSLRQMGLTVNGNPLDDVEFRGTSTTNRMGSTSGVQLSLTAGTNTIRLTDTGSRGPRIDFLGLGGDGAIRERLQPTPSSQLYQALCVPVAGACTFPTKVTLSSNLPCQTGTDECSAGRVMVVEIVDPSNGLRQFYTHRARACVRLALFVDGRVTRASSRSQCTAELAPMSVTCCLSGTTTRLPVDLTAGDCLFANEAVPYAVASSRCSARGGSICEEASHATYNQNACAEDTFVWTTSSCDPQVEIYPDGKVGLIDPVTTDDSRMWMWMAASRNTFRVRWDNPALVPNAVAGCGAGCEVSATADGDSCLCNITISETVPFTDPTTPPSATQIESTLFIGSVPPSTFDTGELVLCATACPPGVQVWTRTSDAGNWTQHTIFQLPPRVAGGAVQYFLNRVSTVNVAAASFRNPPTFMPGLGEQTLDGFEEYLSADLLVAEAEHEVDALLDHLFEHQNTGPFVATRFIQQMVTSNPSPEYVESVVAAFTSGTHGFFGTGNYGDLQATVAAVLLHPEARTSILDADPTSGHAFEPLLKVIAALRALEWTPSFGQPLAVHNSEGKLGMEAFNSPTVFGFYRPEFAAAGEIGDSLLVSPELQLAQTPFIIAYLNGIVSLIDRGLSSCSDGFGPFCNSFGNDDSSIGQQGFLSWQPSSTTATVVLDELALLLTQDRLHPQLRASIAAAYTAEQASRGDTAALRLAQKLVLMSPDFHVSAVNTVNHEPQPEALSTASSGRPFKAIVVLFESGGCDSWNVLVPHSNCRNGDGSGTDAPQGSHAEYAQVRTDGAISQDDLLQIQPPAGSQPCGTYGVNQYLPTFKTLFDTNEGSFITNIGAMIEPFTKADYNGSSGVTKKFPPSLFAHNAQQTALATVHAENVNAKGVLARTVEALLEQDTPFKSELYSISGNQRLLQGSSQGYDIISRSSGVKKFNQFSSLGDAFDDISASQSDSVFADTFSKLIRASLAKTEAIGSELEDVELNVSFGNDRVSQQLEQVAKLIKLRDTLETERAVFVVERGGFDSHNTWDIGTQLGEINSGLTSFVAEMKAQDIWDDVVFVTTSDFARTLTSNGQGSDHAWGGNHYIAGGSVNGGHIFGEFPETLASGGELNIGRGRLLPTVPWEFMYTGVVEWFGVTQAQMSTVLPHAANFPASQRTDSTGSQSLFSSTTGGPETFPVTWEIPTSPASLSITVGDTIAFTWTGFHDVRQMPDGTCNNVDSAPLLAGPSTGDAFNWLSSQPGTFFFACGVGPHCSLGMTLVVTVNPVDSLSPTQSPTASPSTSSPTTSPTASPSTSSPTASPTASPSISSPTASPTSSPSTSSPTASPTVSPSTSSPTASPTVSPSTSPTTTSPSISPTDSPTTSPSFSPTVSPTTSPTTSTPSASPTTTGPTLSPTPSPTASPVPETPPVNPATVTCGGSFTYCIATRRARWTPTLTLPLNGRHTVALHTCGHEGNLSDTRIYAPCSNNNNARGCSRIGLGNLGTNPNRQSLCETRTVYDAGDSVALNIGAQSTRTGCAALNVVCNLVTPPPTASPVVPPPPPPGVTGPNAVQCGEAVDFCIHRRRARYRPTLSIPSSGTHRVTLHTCGHTGNMSDTRIYGTCRNDDNRRGCRAIGIRNRGTNPRFQSLCETRPYAADTVLRLNVGGYRRVIGCATLNVDCARSEEEGLRFQVASPVEADEEGDKSVENDDDFPDTPKSTSSVVAAVAVVSMIVVAVALFAGRRRMRSVAKVTNEPEETEAADNWSFETRDTPTHFYPTSPTHSPYAI